MANSNLAKVYSAELEGIDARLIDVEVDINVGLHSFTIVGLADKALNEAKERVNAALKNSGVKPPNRENRKITVNLAPADVRKTGSQYDAALAVGYLLATGQVKSFSTDDKLFIGELSLEGGMRPVAGVLSIARLAKDLRIPFLFVPKENAREASLIDGITVIPVTSLRELMLHLEGREEMAPHRGFSFVGRTHPSLTNIDDIKGQDLAKRALAVAASGGHHVLMTGSPGAGKTMMAQALLSLFPSPSLDEAIEMTQVYSSANALGTNTILNFRPFRTPHHSASPVSIIGGGTHPRPGEISLAHHGVLFLDELPEFRRDLLEALRQPLESGEVHVTRAKASLRFPARFTLVAAMNPCPCGYFQDEEKTCTCSAYEVHRYQKKVSGPLLDRIDIQLFVPRVKIDELRSTPTLGSSMGDKLRDQVETAREMQARRFAGVSPAVRVNAAMSSRQTDELLNLDFSAEDFLLSMASKLSLSARGYYRTLKVARTIADMEGSPVVRREHLAEAFQYRLRDNE